MYIAFIFVIDMVQRVYGLGIVKGNENNEFMPKGAATRGESAAFINRMLKVIESK